MKINENRQKWHFSERRGAYVFRASTLSFGYVPIYISKSHLAKPKKNWKTDYRKKIRNFLLREAETWKLVCRRFLGPSKRSYPNEGAWPAQSPETRWSKRYDSQCMLSFNSATPKLPPILREAREARALEIFEKWKKISQRGLCSV